MADKVVVFEIDVQPITGQLSSLGKSIEDTKARFEQLKKENGAYDEQTIATQAALKTLQKEYRSLETVLTNQSAAIGEVVKASQKQLNIKEIENNSIDTNRKLYNALYGEYVRAGKEQREKMIPTLKALSDELKKQEAAVGDTRRNVGNYAEGFKDAFSQVASGIPQLKGFQSAQQGVNAVLSANPIGGVVTLLFALKDIVGGNAIVADTLTFAFDGLNKAFGFIVDVVVDTVSNFDKLSQAIRNPIRFIKDLATGTAEAAKEGFNASKALDDFVVSNARTAAAIKENDLQIQALTKSLKDRTKSEQERIKIANTIADLEIQNAARSQKLAQDELAAEQLKLKGRTKSAEQEAKLIELDSKVKQAAAEVNIANSQRQTRINILLEKELATETKKAREENVRDISKLQDEFLLDEREKLDKGFQDKLAQVIGQGDEEVRLRTAILKSRNEALLKFDADAEKKRKDAEEKAIADRIALQSKAFNEQSALSKQLLDNELKRVDLSVASEEEKARRKNEINLQYLQQELNRAIELANIDNTLTETELANIDKLKLAIDELKLKASEPTQNGKTLGDAIGVNKEQQQEINEGLQVITQSVAAIGEIINSAYEIRLNDIENVKNAEISAIEQSGASAEDKQKRVQAAERKAAMETYEIQKKQFETNKAIAIVQTIINTAQAVIAQLSNPTPYVGIVLAALAAATGAAQIAVISSQQPPAPPKFAKGVIGLQGAGTETSDSIDAKLSKGESVMTAKATQRFAPILAQMEMAVGNTPNYQLGNKRFAIGYIPQGDGGYASRYAGAEQSNNVAMADMVRNTVSAIPAPVVSVEEFRRVETSSDTSVAVSEL